MTKSEVIGLLYRIQRRQQVLGVAMLMLPAWGMALVTTVLGYRFLHGLWWVGIPVFAISWGVSIWICKPYHIPLPQVAGRLNALFPQLEESTHLLLKPTDQLSLLERMQLERLLRVLPTVRTQRAITVPYRSSMLVWAASLLVAMVVLLVWPVPELQDKLFAPKAALSNPFRKASLPAKPRISGLTITVSPPAYTGEAVRTQETAAVKAAVDSRVQWHIETDIPAEQVTLVFNHQEVWPLALRNNAWVTEKKITKTGFYQIRLNEELSDFYPLEAIPDVPPIIQITAPKPYQEIPYSQRAQVQVAINLTDDYGLRHAHLVATVAKGTGEAVKFREEKMSLGASFGAYQKEAYLSKLLQLARLDMAPGDELYFYVEASDNHAQWTRSDMYIIALQDTAQVTLADAMTMGINPVPAYFRSQRQIIIDTEKLLKEQPKLSTVVFKQRSNEIGIDQKVLRLRYGKFLGEEFEDMIGEISGQEKLIESGHFDGDGHDHAHDIHGLESFVHAHDESEEATFLAPAIKTKLKACLAEMWEAELRLRTYRPKEALPFAYKALKLLKEVQQSSRAYVAKTGFEPPPLKPQERRLTGELDKITAPTYQQTQEPKPSLPAIRQALPVLAKLTEGHPLTSHEVKTLEKAGAELSAEAIRQPGRYLSALKSLRQLISTAKETSPTICQDCLHRVQQAIWLVLPSVDKSPQTTNHSGSTLGDMYLKGL